MSSLRHPLSVEAQLLLASIRPDLGSAQVSKLLEPSLDWAKVTGLALREQAVVPLWRTIEKVDDHPPEADQTPLKPLAQVLQFKLLNLRRSLVRTLKAFDEAGIDVILLKGAAAVTTVYEDALQRPMLDVDLLVDPARVKEAWELAQSLDWRWDSSSFPLESYETAHHFPPLQDRFGTGAGLELHTGLWLPGHPFRFTEDDLWKVARRIERDGYSVLVPPTEHQLLHCCIHFAWSHRLTSHSWRAFSDVSAFVRSGTLDWSAFVRLAQHSNAAASCYWTLSLASSIARVPVPDTVLRTLRPPAPTVAVRALERHYALNLLPDGRQSPSVALNRWLWQLGTGQRKRAKGIDLPGAPEPMSLKDRGYHHLRNVRRWSRYVRALTTSR